MSMELLFPIRRSAALGALASRLLLVLVGPLLAWSSVGAGQPARPAAPAQAQDDFFGDFADTEEAPSREQLRALLGEVPGSPGEIAESRSKERSICRLSGLFRLKGEWTEGTAIRFCVLDCHMLQLHFWNGSRGVTLRYYPEFHKAWAAYGTLRKDDDPQPHRLALWATDEGRYQRCGTGTFEVRYHGGRLVMVRGDVALLSVPFAGPPGEVYVQCTGLVRGLAMFSSRSVPPVPASAPAVLATSRPAELLWQSTLSPGASLAYLPNGQVELSAEGNAEQALAWTTVRRPGLYEYIFEVESPAVGTGVYLGDEQGKPLYRVGFFRYAAGKQTTFELVPPWSNDTEKAYAPLRQVIPYAGQRQWLRLVMGAGIVKLWTSGDAVHWSQIAPKSEGASGACWTVGLYALAGQKRRSIRLCSLELRQLDAVAWLAPESVQQYVGELVDADTLESWEKQVAETRPAGVGREVWWRACAVRTLARSSKGHLGQTLLEKLQKQIVAEQGDPAQRLRFFQQSALLRSCEEWDGVDRLAAHAERLGITLAVQGEPCPATTISGALMRVSFWTQRRLPVFSEKLVREELVSRLSEGRLDDVRQLCRRLEYWLRGETREAEQHQSIKDVRHLLNWAQFQTDRRLPKSRSRQSRTRPVPGLHPLVERLSREGYNVLAELQAALDGRAHRDAAQIIATSPGIEGLDLLPDKKDERLLISLPIAIEATMREHPELRAAMQEQFGALSRLRLRQAIETADATAVEAVALQFYGTESAAQAAAWLGDRALAAGRLAEAVSRYTAACRWAPEADRDALSARLRLAAAFSGVDSGKPSSAPVRIGSKVLSAAGFERLVQEMRQRPQAATVGEGRGNPTTQSPPPAPGRYEARPFAQIDGRDVHRPHALPERGIDWAGRQIGVAVTPADMLVNNGVQQFAFDLLSGKARWVQQQSLEAGHQQWPLLRMVPQVFGNRILVRRLSQDGPELVCLDAASGQIMWSSKPGGHVVSEALILGDCLHVLAASYASGGGDLGISLVGLTWETGRVRMQFPLIDLQDFWGRRVPCQAVVIGDRIVATVGGCVLSCDYRGHLQWVRLQTWIRPPSDGYHFWNARQWFEQSHDPPLIDGGRIYATQPGVWEVECISVETGRLIWRRAIGGLTRMVGLSRGRLLVEAGDQILALDRDSGRPLWCRDLENRLETQLCGQPETLLCVQLSPITQSQKPPEVALVWVDPETGQQKSKTVVPALSRSEPWLKPLVVFAGRQWAFLTTASDAAKREILELLRVGDDKTAQAEPSRP